MGGNRIRFAQKGESHMNIVTFVATTIALVGISGSALCQSWNQCAHVSRVDTFQAGAIEAVLVPAQGMFLAATDHGICRTSDAGNHWSLPLRTVRAPLPLAQGGALFSHPDGRIFAGTLDGLAFSTDLGISWNAVPSHPGVLTCKMIRDTQGRLFTATWDLTSSASGVCRSTDNGVTWPKVLDSVYVETVETGPGDLLFVGGRLTLYRSADAGQTWDTLHAGASFRSVTVTQNGSILSGLYRTNPLWMVTARSTNNGTSWGWAAGFYAEYFARDANQYVYVACDSGMRRTTDNGTTWQVLNTGLRNSRGEVPWLRSLVRSDGTAMTAGECHTGELFHSTDLGSNWHSVPAVRVFQAVPAILSSMTFKKPGRLFLASSRFGILEWTEDGVLNHVNNSLADLKVLAVHTTEDGDLFAGTASGVYRSTNNGLGWAKFGAASLITKAVADMADGSILAGTNAGVIKHAADGSSLSVMSTGLVNRSVNTLWSGTDGRTFVGTEDGFYRLDSITWVPLNVSASELRVIDIDVCEQTIAIATRDSGVYVSMNNGQLWQHKTAGMEGLPVTAVVLTAKDKLYAATATTGVFATTSGASTWTALSGGLTDQRLKDLALGPGGFHYVISDSGALSRTTSALVSVSDLCPAQTMAFVLHQNYPNPFNPSTTICYGLPERSHVSLAVYNTLGQQVAILQNGEQEAGYHDVKFDASNLPSGVYFYRVQAGSYVETKKLLAIR
jgi:ligand-binding sensor domain-containing protein